MRWTDCSTASQGDEHDAGRAARRGLHPPPRSRGGKGPAEGSRDRARRRDSQPYRRCAADGRGRRRDERQEPAGANRIPGGDRARGCRRGAGSASVAGALEIAAVLVLGVGGFFFSVLGMVVGIVLVWISIAWRTRDKLVATAVALAFTLVPALLWVLAVASGTRGVVVALGPFAMLVVFGGTSGIGGLLGALYLAAGRAQAPTRSADLPGHRGVRSRADRARRAASARRRIPDDLIAPARRVAAALAGCSQSDAGRACRRLARRFNSKPAAGRLLYSITAYAVLLRTPTGTA